MYLYQSTVNIDNLRCFDNEGKVDGGCIYSAQSGSSIINSDFYMNQANDGSVAYLY